MIRSSRARVRASAWNCATAPGPTDSRASRPTPRISANRAGSSWLVREHEIGVSVFMGASVHLQPDFKSRPVKDVTLTIGQVAQRAGLNASAIRFYEAEGLLPEPARVGGQRRYREDTLARLGVIDVAKRAGFSLDDIRILLDGGGPAHQQLQSLARRKLPEVDELIARAQRVRGWLEAATDCDCETLDVCELFARQEHLPPEGLRESSVP
jgi:MerR family redox-sensitive transcriptional activator SoxR